MDKNNRKLKILYEDWRNFGKMKWNESGRQKLGRSPVSRHSMKSYIRTYFRRNFEREPLIAIGSHHGRGVGGDDLNTLALRKWSQTA